MSDLKYDSEIIKSRSLASYKEEKGIKGKLDFGENNKGGWAFFANGAMLGAITKGDKDKSGNIIRPFNGSASFFTNPVVMTVQSTDSLGAIKMTDILCNGGNNFTMHEGI